MYSMYSKQIGGKSKQSGINFTVCNANFYVPRVFLFLIQTAGNKEIEKVNKVSK